MNDLEILRPAAVFAVVVEEGSFRAAASRLGLSPPYVSQLISDLETRMGRQLLYRSTRKISLSADGERFLPIAQQIAGALHDGLSTFRSDTHELAGQLRLSVPTILAAQLFARLLAEFQARHPKLELHVHLDDQPVDPLDRGTDLAIRIGEPVDDARPARLLFRTQGVICASADMAATLRTPRELETQRWIKTPAMGAAFELSNAKRAQTVRIAPTQGMVTNNGLLTTHLVAQGAGWAAFPEFAVRGALSSGQLARALPDWAVPNVGVYGLYSARNTALSNAKSFVDFLVARLA